MKVNQLKNIIKEAVKEAVREEIKEILTEAISSASNPETIVEAPAPKVQKPKFKAKGDPIMEMLNMTQQSMTREDFKNFTGGQAQPGMNEIKFTSNSLTSPIPSGPQPGIDISQLDFVGKAAAIYNKSIEKDKSRMGG